MPKKVYDEILEGMRREINPPVEEKNEEPPGPMEVFGKVEVTNFPEINIPSPVVTIPEQEKVGGKLDAIYNLIRGISFPEFRFPSIMEIFGKVQVTNLPETQKVEVINQSEFPKPEKFPEIMNVNLISKGVQITNGHNYPVPTVSGMMIPPYDNITLGYTGSNLTSVIYKAGGNTVATLTLAYTGSDLTSVVKT